MGCPIHLFVFCLAHPVTTACLWSRRCCGREVSCHDWKLANEDLQTDTKSRGVRSRDPQALDWLLLGGALPWLANCGAVAVHGTPCPFSA